jgi:DNA polymerase-1
VAWSQDTTADLVEAGVQAATAWDVAAVHRLLSGGRRAEPAQAWAAAHGLAIDGLPAVGRPDLFSQTEHDDSEEPVRSDGYPRPESADGGWAASAKRVGRWAGLGGPETSDSASDHGPSSRQTQRDGLRPS